MVIGPNSSVEFGDLQPLAGGWSGQTFVSDVAGERTVVRIYPPEGPRGPAAPEIDAAMLRLVRGLLPVPDVVEVRRASPADQTPGLLVTTFLPGERGDLLLPRLDHEQLSRVGHHLGRIVADLAGMPMLRAGVFVDADLRIRPFPAFADGLPAWVESHRPALRGWSPARLADLDRLAEAAQEVLDRVGRVCLVHSDFNPKNLLIDPDSLTVTGVLDWEFAHAGSPFSDLGNLLRFGAGGLDTPPRSSAALDHRRDTPPRSSAALDHRHVGDPFTDAVLAEYAARHGVEPSKALELARAADLWALIDLAARAGENPVADAADRLLRDRAAQA